MHRSIVDAASHDPGLYRQCYQDPGGTLSRTGFHVSRPLGRAHHFDYVQHLHPSSTFGGIRINMMSRTWIAYLTTLLAHCIMSHAQDEDSGKCELYGYTSASPRPPFSEGVYNLSSMRPFKYCRTFMSPLVESAIEKTAAQITDPDLRRLFINAFPNTLDTTIRWQGVSADNPDEELAFIITGDIPAMWLRDSANQLQSYAPLLSNKDDKLAALFRGAINLQARYLLINPYCQSFQAPPESGLRPERNYAYNNEVITPPHDNKTVFECKWELDSLAAFLQLSETYYTKTNDVDFFRKFNWVRAVESIMQVAENMTEQNTYNDDGTVKNSSYTFSSLRNGGIGAPTRGGTGLIRVAFRPSDDDTIYSFFIPANMKFVVGLENGMKIAEDLGNSELASKMKDKASSLRSAIQAHGIVTTPEHGQIYAYEIDGYGGVNLMDDANSPSLLSSAYFGYVDKSDPVFQNTRARILSTYNPYWAHGKVLSVIGSPHSGPANGWPMAAIIRILTSDDDKEITQQLYQLVSSTAGLGLMHESVNAHNASQFTRPWFAWANGLFGQAVYELAERKPHILKQSFQDTSVSKDDSGDLEYVPKYAEGERYGGEDEKHTASKIEAHKVVEPVLHRRALDDMTWFWYLALSLIMATGAVSTIACCASRRSWMKEN